MKRIVFMILLSIVVLALFAQEMIEIGDSSESAFSPIYPYHSYSVSQQIYLQTELEELGFTGGNITHIAFQANSDMDLSNSKDWFIHIGETDSETFTEGGWMPLSELTEVFDGDIAITDISDGDWLIIALTTPFDYTGTANLIISVLEYTEGESGEEVSFRATTATEDCVIYNHDSEDAFVPKGSTELGDGYTTANRPNLQITYSTPIYDIAVQAITAPSLLPTAHPMTITLKNNGNLAIAEGSYTIGVSMNEDVNPIFIFQNQDAVEIPVGQSRSFIIPSVILNMIQQIMINGDFSLNILVTSLTETENTIENNTGTAFISIFAGDFTTEGIAEVGMDGDTTSSEFPFALGHQDNISQSIYTATDFGDVAMGAITHVNYKVSIASDENLENPYLVSIYMAHTIKPEGFTSDSDWVAGSAFTKVVNDYELPISEIGNYDFWIPLDMPFIYEGGDLVVMTYQDHDFTSSDTNGFLLSSPQSQFVTLHSQSDNDGTSFDPADIREDGTLETTKPQMRFAFTMNGYGIIIGMVMDEASMPLANAIVTLETTDYVTTTDEYGMFKLSVDITSDALFIVSANGYISQSFAINELQWSGNPGIQQAFQMVTMTPAPQITVTGTVTFVDSGLPVEGVTVYIGTFASDTDSEGLYTISGVSVDTDYQVSVPMTAYIGYMDYVDAILISAEDVVEGEYTLDITITEQIRPPHNVTANVTETGSRMINWNIPTLEIEPINRAFAEKYLVYRLAENDTFDNATLLTETPITDNNIAVSYEDITDLPRYSYKYAVTAIYEGELYPEIIESEPTYSNILTHSVPVLYPIYGNVVTTEGGLEGATVTLTYADASEGWLPEPVTTSAWTGGFTIMALEGDYILTVEKEDFESVSLLITLTSDGLELDPILLTGPSSDTDLTHPFVTTLKGNYPNPFNPSTTIAFDIAREGQVSLDVFNILGQKVKTLANGKYSAGSHTVVWNGDDAYGRSVGSGIYFLRMTTNGYEKTQKMMMLK